MSSIRFLKKPVILAPLVAGLLLPCIALLVLHFSRSAASQSRLVLKDAVYISGQPLPQTELVELDGSSVAPDTLRKGKVLLIFLTTDCPACQKELQLLASVDSELAEKVKVFGVGVQDRNQIVNFLEAKKFKTKFLIDKDGQLMASLSVRYFPARFLVQDGVIMKTSFGNSRNQAELFKELGF